jgi:hypothetical protein
LHANDGRNHHQKNQTGKNKQDDFERAAALRLGPTA